MPFAIEPIDLLAYNTTLSFLLSSPIPGYMSDLIRTITHLAYFFPFLSYCQTSNFSHLRMDGLGVHEKLGKIIT